MPKASRPAFILLFRWQHLAVGSRLVKSSFSCVQARMVYVPTSLDPRACEAREEEERRRLRGVQARLLCPASASPCLATARNLIPLLSSSLERTHTLTHGQSGQHALTLTLENFLGLGCEKKKKNGRCPKRQYTNAEGERDRKKTLTV